jgi:hypothetical protein
MFIAAPYNINYKLKFQQPDNNNNNDWKRVVLVEIKVLDFIDEGR